MIKVASNRGIYTMKVLLCVRQDYYRNFAGDSMKYAVLREMHNFVKDKHNYVTYYHDPLKNIITKIPLLDSNNLRKFLNTKP